MDLYVIIGYFFGSIVVLCLYFLSWLGKKLIIGGVGYVVVDEWDMWRNDVFCKVIEEVVVGKDIFEVVVIFECVNFIGGIFEGYLGVMMFLCFYMLVDLLIIFSIFICVIIGDKDFDNGLGEKLVEIILDVVYC